MHTDIAKMKYQNNQQVTVGVKTDTFKGLIFAGHIHKRQTKGKVTYVGNPYQLNRGDIGNKKGLYVLDVASGKTQFIENDVSPQFLQIKVDDFDKMSEDERQIFFKNNYVDIIIENNTNVSSIYKKIENLKAKKITIIMKDDNKSDNDENIDFNIKNMSLKDVISLMIENLDISESDKAKIKATNENYFVSLNSIDLQ